MRPFNVRSQIFFDGHTRKKFVDRSVNSFSIFKKGIKPKWEDEANRGGGEWFCRKRMDPKQLDEYWRVLRRVWAALGHLGLRRGLNSWMRAAEARVEATRQLSSALAAFQQVGYRRCFLRCLELRFQG